MSRNPAALLRIRPSTLTGMARTLDIGATFGGFRRHDTPAQADLTALRQDFVAIGDDLDEAVRVVQNRA